MRVVAQEWVRARVPAAWWWRGQQARAVVSSHRRGDSPLTRQLGAGRCGEVVIRPIAAGDAEAWTRAMRGNARRMAPWWNVAGEDVERQTDRVAFESHRQVWDRRRRRGHGVCLALVGPTGLFGELQVWHLTPNGLTCEIGLWMHDGEASTKDAGACLGYAFDRLFDIGVRRIDAPVAVENRLPRSFLRVGGFQIDARVPEWRALNGTLVDYDLFGLTLARWEKARPTARRVLGEWWPDGAPASTVS